MEHPFSSSHFCELIWKYLRERMLTQEEFAAKARISREYANRVISGASKASAQFVGAAAYILCSSPHECRIFFRAAGLELDSSYPHYDKLRDVLDNSHDPDDENAVREGLDILASIGFANKDRDKDKDKDGS